jgi:hypothetical protein
VVDPRRTMAPPDSGKTSTYISVKGTVVSIEGHVPTCYE